MNFKKTLGLFKTALPALGARLTRRQFVKALAASLGVLLLPWRRSPFRSEARAEKGSLDCLSLITIRPGRPHLVRAGSVTTFVVAVTNDTQSSRTVSLVAQSQTPGWTVDLSRADRLFQATGTAAASMQVTVAAGGIEYLVVSLRPYAGMAEGSEGSAVVRAYIQQQPVDDVLVRGKVTSRPNVYLFAIDGLNRKYLALSRKGEEDPNHRNPLMPNLLRFCQDAAVLSKARSHLPSYTDPNHVSYLTGSWPGTSGVYAVKEFYCGRDADGNPVKMAPSRDILRWGPSGERVVSIFDLAKDPAMGGDPDACNALITGKPWLWGYFREESNVVDILASGSRFPFYVDPPPSYVMGDPPSDSNAATDRDGINVTPPEQFHALHDPFWGTLGERPSDHPDDRWIVESALKIIAAEDPQVFYVVAACVDIVGHHVGAADKPGLWQPGQSPDALWDDLNAYTYRANREPMLDAVYEADTCFGIFVNALKARQTYSNSILACISDHGMRTYFDQPLNYYSIITGAGIPQDAIELAACRGELIHIFVKDPSYVAPVQQALRNYTVYHPVWQKEVHPFVVLNQEEMATGVDAVVGRVAASKGPKRSELYSEWYIDHPVEDNSKPRWPDLLVFLAGGYQGVSNLGEAPPVGGHGGVGPVQDIMYLIRGPGIRKGVYSANPAFPVDLLPTLCRLLDWQVPANADGRVLGEILAR
jgi:hypothetical protein